MNYQIVIQNIQLMNNQQQHSEDDDIRDSALDTYSETSSLIEPINSKSICTK